MRWTLNRRTFYASLVMAALMLAASSCGEMAGGRAKATFVVSWYDVGAHALDGQNGVISVEKGWYGFSEVDRIVYEPGKISIDQMENLLKSAGTYIRTMAKP